MAEPREQFLAEPSGYSRRDSSTSCVLSVASDQRSSALEMTRGEGGEVEMTRGKEEKSE